MLPGFTLDRESYDGGIFQVSGFNDEELQRYCSQNIFSKTLTNIQTYRVPMKTLKQALAKIVTMAKRRSNKCLFQI